MNDDLLLELMKHDELVTEIKKSILDHVARNNAIEKLQKERSIVTKRKIANEEQERKKITAINEHIRRIEHQQNNLYSIIDEYGDVVCDAPHFTKEAVDLLIKFVKDFKEVENG